MMRVFLTALFAALMCASGAAAQDYHFTVPVRIENMRNAVNPYVSCNISIRRGGGLVGYGRMVEVPMVDGNFSGTVDVTVPLPAPAGGETEILASDVRGYMCFLAYVWRRADGTLYSSAFASAADRNRAYTRDTGQAIVSFNMEWQDTAPAP